MPVAVGRCDLGSLHPCASQASFVFHAAAACGATVFTLHLSAEAGLRSGLDAAEKENAMMAANGTRPRHATVGDDFAASMKKVGRMGFSLVHAHMSM